MRYETTHSQQNALTVSAAAVVRSAIRNMDRCTKTLWGTRDPPTAKQCPFTQSGRVPSSPKPMIRE
eukprot:scaffold306494_cov28-Tisochrysis_lutea.AAC.1